MTIAILGRHRQVDIFDYDTTKKPVLSVCGMSSFGMQRFPTDPIGAFALTLTNVVIGSRVHIEKQSDGTTFYDGVAGTATVSVSLSAYSAGDASNDLRIKVRNASSSPAYKPFETLTTALIGSNSIYVSQIPDE